jgi:pimeloyl-ACP methyl ester carboxylesterase
MLVGCASTQAAAPDPSRDPSRSPTPIPTPIPTPTPHIVDSGELALTLRGKPFGSETFSIEARADGYTLRAEVKLEVGSTMRLLDSELYTDRAWRPVSGRFRDVKDGGTISILAPASSGRSSSLGTNTASPGPLVLRGTAPFAPPSERTASRAIELFLADNTMSHFAPLCAIPAPTTRVSFPGMTVTVGADVAAPGSPGTQPVTTHAHPSPTLTRRHVDLGGTMRVLLACERGRLVGVEVPLVGLTAIRTGRATDVAALADATTRKPALAAGLVEEPRTVRVRASRHGDAAELACSLVRPATATSDDVTAAAARAARELRPAVILLTGSGAQDRDGDTVGPGGVKPALLKVLASALGEGGVISLRCDDRGAAASTGAYGEATLDTFVGDADAMLAALLRERGVDRRRVVVVGHSEGAVVATLLAARAPRKLAGLALLAGPGRDIDVVLLEQIERTLRAAGLTPDEVVTALDHHRGAFAAMRAGEPLPETAEAKEWVGGEAWVRSHLRRDLLATAAALDRVAVLVAQGDVDRQVTMADAHALVTAFRAGGNARVTLARYRSLDHNFAHSETGAVADYVDADRAIDPQFVADVVAFVNGAR